MAGMLTALMLASACALQEAKEKDPASSKEAMRRIQVLVGEWRVSGRPEEDSKEEPWSEKHNWNYKIDKDVFSIQLTLTDGKLYKDGLLTYDLGKKVYRLEATRADGKKATYEGKLAGKEIVLEQVVAEGAEQDRLNFSLLRDNRILMAREKRAAGTRTWLMTHSFGCTKEGVPFVRSEGPRCVVTGGTPAIAVEHGGKTYYVC